MGAVSPANLARNFVQEIPIEHFNHSPTSEKIRCLISSPIMSAAEKLFTALVTSIKASSILYGSKLSVYSLKIEKILVVTARYFAGSFSTKIILGSSTLASTTRKAVLIPLALASTEEAIIAPFGDK